MWFVARDLFLLLDLFELAFKSLDALVDCLFECVAGLGCEHLRSRGHVELDESLLVASRFRFYDLEGHFSLGDEVEASEETVDFFMDKAFEALGDVEMDGIDFRYHNRIDLKG
jgi:hypothetical protein